MISIADIEIRYCRHSASGDSTCSCPNAEETSDERMRDAVSNVVMQAPETSVRLPPFHLLMTAATIQIKHAS
jgi:hypothetical protein